MAQDPERTIVNIKAMPVESWTRAKKAAEARGETLGEWVSRACDQLARLEAAGGYELTKPEPAPPPPPIDLREIAALLAAMADADVRVQKRVASRVNARLYQALSGPRVSKLGTDDPIPGSGLSTGLALPRANGYA